MATCVFKLALVLALLARTLDAATLAVQQQQRVVAGITITTPPQPSATGECTKANLFKRTTAPSSCTFGACGSDCLTQGAFCCGPAGTLATAPNWVCDNGACITSVRGQTGIVDCYDPENPSGSTQSCLDNIPTATCNPTDRCYQCSTDVPFCHWQTYIAPGSPTLRWFSCVNSTRPYETYFATSVTQNLLATTLPSTSNTTSLPTGAFIGIAIGGAAALIIIVVLITCLCLKRKRKSKRTDPPPPEHSTPGEKLPPQGSMWLKDMPPQDIPPQEMPIPNQEGTVALWATGRPMTEAASTPISELPGHAVPPPSNYLDPLAQAPQPHQSPTPMGRGYSSGSDLKASPDPYHSPHSIGSRPSMPSHSPVNQSQTSSQQGTISPHSQSLQYHRSHDYGQRTPPFDEHHPFLPDAGHQDRQAQGPAGYDQYASAYNQSAPAHAQQYGLQQQYYPPPQERTTSYSSSGGYHDTGQGHGSSHGYAR